MNTEVMFSSEKQDWETPRDFFNKLNDEFKFEMDVCATKHNSKCKHYISPEQDSLSMEWYNTSLPIDNQRNVFWMNPPYGNEIKDWTKKAHQEAQKGATIVALLPSRTDTRWFHNYIYKHGYEIRFVKGRLKFVGAKNPAPFPSMVVIFKKDDGCEKKPKNKWWKVW